MAWVNALLIGSCTLVYQLNNAPATLSELNAAGITIDTAGGVITATWDGVTGSPTGLRIEVHPAYELSNQGSRIAAVSVHTPFVGADPIGDQGFDGFDFETSPFTDLPWTAEAPFPTEFFGCFAAAGV